MPIYEFACQDCGHEFEKIQSFSDSTTPDCPNCQGRHVQRRLSAPAIHFKGSGWYITDSKNAGKSSATGPKNGEEGKGESSKGDTAKSDTGAGEAAKSDSTKSEPSSTSATKPASESSAA